MPGGVKVALLHASQPTHAHAQQQVSCRMMLSPAPKDHSFSNLVLPQLPKVCDIYLLVKDKHIFTSLAHRVQSYLQNKPEVLVSQIKAKFILVD